MTFDIMSKIKLKDKKVEELFHKQYVGSCRNQSLQNLLLIWFNFVECEAFEQKLRNRRPPSEFPNIDGEYKWHPLYYIKAEDIMQILQCSKRTAEDYRAVIRELFHVLDGT